MTTPTDDDNVVVPFLQPDVARRLRNEVERLSRMSPAEYLYYLEQGAHEKYPPLDKPTMLKMVEKTIRDRERQERIDKADERIEKRAAERRETETKTLKLRTETSGGSS